MTTFKEYQYQRPVMEQFTADFVTLLQQFTEAASFDLQDRAMVIEVTAGIIVAVFRHEFYNLQSAFLAVNFG